MSKFQITLMYNRIIIHLVTCVKSKTFFSFWTFESPYVYRYKSTIVCLTRVWQSLFLLFCDKTFEFAIQTWQTSLEHYYVQTYIHIHCRHYDLACLSVANNTNTRDRIVGNGHILQWDLMSKINILRS